MHTNPENEEKWCLWRQDDNGHKFMVGVFSSEVDAWARYRQYEEGYHKQTYWIESVRE